MKKIIILLLTLFLFSCQSENKKENIVKEEKIKIDEAIVIEEINKSITLENEKILPHYKTNKKVTQKWKKEKIWKISCKSGAWNLGDTENKIVSFWKSEETKLLQKKVDDFNKREDIIWWFTRSISEFCKNKESNKYIFWTQDKPIFTFWRYDKYLDIIEPATFKYKTFSYIWWDRHIRWYNIKLEKYYNSYVEKNNFNWFWKRIWDKVEIKDFWRPLTDNNDFSTNILKKKNEKYCYNWLTPKWNKSICFADVYYSYDFIENILTEDKICTYYIDDNWKIQTLESCKIFSY